MTGGQLTSNLTDDWRPMESQFTKAMLKTNNRRGWMRGHAPTSKDDMQQRWHLIYCLRSAYQKTNSHPCSACPSPFASFMVHWFLHKEGRKNRSTWAWSLNVFTGAELENLFPKADKHHEYWGLIHRKKKKNPSNLCALVAFRKTLWRKWMFSWKRLILASFFSPAVNPAWLLAGRCWRHLLTRAKNFELHRAPFRVFSLFLF